MRIIGMYMYTYLYSCTVYMLGTKHGFAQSVDCPAQSVDLCFALAIHGMRGPLLATLPAR